MVYEGRDPPENQPTATPPIPAIPPSLPPRKLLLAGLSRGPPSPLPDSASYADPDTVAGEDSDPRPLPDLSECHACGYSSTPSGGTEKLRPVKSGWRVFILCQPCKDAVGSGEVCSYCFVKLSDRSLAFSCNECGCLVHRSCGLQQRNSVPDSDSFVCVDCWLHNSAARDGIRAPSENCLPKVGFENGASTEIRDERNQREGTTLSGSCSVEGSRGSLVGGSSRPLEEIVREANFESKKKAETARLAKAKAKRMATNARRAASLAKKALTLAAIAAREESSRDHGFSLPGNCSKAVDLKEEADDRPCHEELVFRLRKTVNCSKRISKKKNCVNQERSSSKENGFLTYYRYGLNRLANSEGKGSPQGALGDSVIGSGSDSSDASKSESGSRSVCGKFEACTEDKLCENPDRLDTEPSVGPVEIKNEGTNHEYVGDQNIDQERRRNDGESDASLREICERLVGNGVEGDQVRGTRFDVQVKEEQASCSNKPTNSSGDDNSLDSEFESCQMQHVRLAVGDVESTYCQGESSKFCNTPSRIGDEPCSSQPLKRRAHSSGERPKKYTRRCLGVEGVSEKKDRALSEDFGTESQASADVGRLWKPNFCKNSAAFSNASCQSPSVPQQASACASGVSGCGS